MKRSLRLPAEPTSVRAARRFVTEVLYAYPPAAIEAVALMTSELATNSIVHAGTGFVLTLTTAGPVVEIEVVDTGADRPQLASPAPTDFHGRGLRIVEQLATAWGTDRWATPSGNRTWFRLETTGHATA